MSKEALKIKGSSSKNVLLNKSQTKKKLKSQIDVGEEVMLLTQSDFYDNADLSNIYESQKNRNSESGQSRAAPVPDKRAINSVRSDMTANEEQQRTVGTAPETAERTAEMSKQLTPKASEEHTKMLSKQPVVVDVSFDQDRCKIEASLFN